METCRVNAARNSLHISRDRRGDENRRCGTARRRFLVFGDVRPWSVSSATPTGSVTVALFSVGCVAERPQRPHRRHMWPPSRAVSHPSSDHSDDTARLRPTQVRRESGMGPHCTRVTSANPSVGGLRTTRRHITRGSRNLWRRNHLVDEVGEIAQPNNGWIPRPVATRDARYFDGARRDQRGSDRRPCLNFSLFHLWFLRRSARIHDVDSS
jgi:hypothetical protein